MRQTPLLYTLVAMGLALGLWERLIRQMTRRKPRVSVLLVSRDPTLGKAASASTSAYASRRDGPARSHQELSAKRYH
jgi:hypothetical protein